MGNENHHNKKSNNDSVKGKDISKAPDTIFNGITVISQIPPPNAAHNNR